MARRTIALYLRSHNYTGLYIFAQGIHDGVQRLAALYPSPVPSLAVFQASINKMKKSVEEWGERGSIGGTPEKTALLQAQDVLRGHLHSYANYVMVAQPDNFQSWTDVGFALRKPSAKTGIMEAVQYFHQFIARNIPQGQIKLKWKRPLSAPKSTVITYKILRSADELFSHAMLVGTTVNKATYIDTPGKAGVLFYYWVIPVTAAGDGARSEVCAAFASPI